QTVAWTMLGVALSAYEHWLADEAVSLAQALGDAFDTVSDGLQALDRSQPTSRLRTDRQFGP
ncbi:MAG: TetR/AcrR family transcriptional regulator, regulator of mycofactocin system, partial [Mycobacterium sp.]|nr:TetR/AcrR family transcriptional regulator, regulator of mycofactocin system [Mycobacterium sp.]